MSSLFEQYIALLEDLQENGQDHVYQHMLETAETNALEDCNASHPFAQQLRKVSISASISHFNAAMADKPLGAQSQLYQPVPVSKSINTTTMSQHDRDGHSAVGMDAIRRGTVAAVILSGGQGTRLGFDGPKGMYNLGLPSGKSIFQLHIEKIKRMQVLSGGSSNVPVYIMTSDINQQVISDYFKANDFFGSAEQDFFFFQQDLEPCFTFDGKMIIESPTVLSMAPDGNGGIYKALLNSGAVADMERRGVEHLHVYGIDNVLTQSIDPIFMGICIEKEAEVGNKVVWRKNAGEKVGVTAESHGCMHVLEYSEIPSHLADAIDSSTCKLLFGAANICNHYIKTSFLTDVVAPNLSSMYHVAKKKIPYYDPATGLTVHPSVNNGVKLEMFIFDVFPLAGSKWVVVEGDRQDEFAPVKNEPGNVQDSPDTARQMISDQATKWLIAAGATVVNTNVDNSVVEVSPLLSYAGEGLEAAHGRTFTAPCYVSGL